MTDRIRVVIADDEPLARERLRELLKEHTDVDLVAECADGRQALDAVRNQQPDILFLDVEMPELNGFGVLENLGTNRFPLVIFVTAYDRYALQAFEAHALDYILKPFDRERFDRALNEARERLREQRSEEMTSRILSLLHEMSHQQSRPERLVIKSGGRVVFVRTEEIDWVEAAGNYVALHVGKESHLLRETMNGFEAKLDPAKFVRIHRSAIVNIDRIKELKPLFGGDYTVILRDHTELTMSRSYRDRLDQILERSTK